MKKIFYFIYSLLFRLYRLFPVKENRISLVSPHNADFNDSMKYVREEFEKRGEYEFNCFSSAQLNSARGSVDFFLKNAFRTATSRFVFLNDNFMPFSGVKFSKKTTVVQLWHGQGAFKKFGLDSNLSESERALAKKCSQKYDYIAVSSKNLSKIYASAFGVCEEKIIACGIPESDFFFSKKFDDDLRQKYSIPVGKKIALYAPTFRENPKADSMILDHFSLERFVKEVGDEYQLLYRLHPQVHSDKHNFEGAIDVGDYPDVNSLLAQCDLLISDYSSICMGFALLRKPMIFYAYDLEEYEKERSFYYEYVSYVPGKIAYNMDELIEAVKKGDFQQEKTEPFYKINFDYSDGCSSKRLADFLLEQSTEKKGD